MTRFDKVENAIVAVIFVGALLLLAFLLYEGAQPLFVSEDAKYPHPSHDTEYVTGLVPGKDFPVD